MLVGALSVILHKSCYCVKEMELSKVVANQVIINLVASNVVSKIR